MFDKGQPVLLGCQSTRNVIDFLGNPLDGAHSIHGA
jgi:hypothetical protein